ncbi:MAG: C2H2-type zinc finger protein [Nitrososphaerales archaeon]
MTVEEKVALASAISDDLEGSGIALIKGEEIAIDKVTEAEVGTSKLFEMVKDFISNQKDSAEYLVDVTNDVVNVRSRRPLSEAKKGQGTPPLPGLFQCPVCGYVTPFKEKYDLHIRSHDLIRGLAG